MENRVEEDYIKELEEEIDSAVDRLFVDKKSTLIERVSMGSAPGESSADKKSGLTENMTMEPSPHESFMDKRSVLAEKVSIEEPVRHEFSVDKKSSLTEKMTINPTPHESFMDKEGSMTETLSIESLGLETSSEPVKVTDEESPHPSPKPSPYMKLFEKVETQLLSLEWEITRENLQKTRDEVVALRGVLKERPDINSVLNLMEKVLIQMIKNDEHIQPPQIKFLLDSKEAIKLLMKKESSSEINTYKQLVFGGIGARFLCLEGLKETRGTPASSSAIEETGLDETLKVWEDQMEGILERMTLFSKKWDELLRKFEYDLSRFGEMSLRYPQKFVERKLPLLDIIILRIDENLFGIESQKVFKLFRLPNAYQDKISSQQRIRLKEFDIQMVDPRKLFLIESKGRRGFPAGRAREIHVLTVKEGDEYKGLIVDQLLKKLSAEADTSKDYGEYFLGAVHWTYQGKGVNIPIINLKKI